MHLIFNHWFETNIIRFRFFISSLKLWNQMDWDCKSNVQNTCIYFVVISISTIYSELFIDNNSSNLFNCQWECSCSVNRCSKSNKVHMKNMFSKIIGNRKWIHNWTQTAAWCYRLIKNENTSRRQHLKCITTRSFIFLSTVLCLYYEWMNEWMGSRFICVHWCRMRLN